MVAQKETKKPSFMNNVLVIVAAQILVKILGMVYRLVITNIPGFGDIGNGFYQAGYQVYTLLLALSSVGIPNAIAKLVSERTALGDYKGAHRIFTVAFRLFCGIGIACSLFLFFGSDFIANTVICLPGTKYTMMALSPALFFVCASSVIRGYFQGMQDMKATGTTQVLEQIFNCVLTIVLVLLLSDMSAEYMAAGGHAATSISCALSFLYLIGYYKLKMKKVHPLIAAAEDTAPMKTGAAVRRILAISIPISLSSIILSVNRIIDTATITRGIRVAFRDGIPGMVGIPTLAELTKEAGRLAGMLSKSDTLINLPLALNVGFATALVPAISAALAKKNKEEASLRISFSLLISILIIFPCVAGLILFAKPIYAMLYPGAPDGWELLQWSAVSLIFIAMNQTIYGSLQGMGKIFVPAIGLFCGGVAKAILNITLIRLPAVNIYGAVISSIACQALSFAICFTALYRKMPLRISFGKYILKPLLATAGMGVVAFFGYRFLDGFLRDTLATLLAIILAVIIYVALVLILRILTKEEMEELPMGARLTRILYKEKKHGN